MEKRGGWKTSRMTPSPKRGFGPPLLRYVFHPPQVSVLCFLLYKTHDRADQKLFWRGPKIFGRARSLVRFPPPIRFAPPISRPKKSQTKKKVATAGRSYGGPSEKFVEGCGGNFQKLSPNFSEVAFMWKSPDATHFGATS